MKTSLLDFAQEVLDACSELLPIEVGKKRLGDVEMFELSASGTKELTVRSQDLWRLARVRLLLQREINRARMEKPPIS